MNTIHKACLVTVAALGAFAVHAQYPSTPANVVGAWELVANEQTTAEGRKMYSFGNPPAGRLMFDGQGHFSVINARPGLPKFASNSRLDGTAEENKAIVSGTIALYGTYTHDAANNVVTLKVDNSTWPGWIDTEQRRPYVVEGDTMTWSVAAASGGGTAKVTWRRLK
jgi:hypothetical protein